MVAQCERPVVGWRDASAVVDNLDGLRAVAAEAHLDRGRVRIERVLDELLDHRAQVKDDLCAGEAPHISRRERRDVHC